MYDYKGYSPAPWYEHRDEITKIVIGQEVTKLGAWAFVGLKYVTELSIPVTLNSVVSDTYPAFAGCYRIETIEFTFGNNGCCPDYSAYEGNNNWYQLTPWYQSRDSLKEIRFADGITHIGADAFRELNITSVVLPGSVTSLGCHCFFNCTKLSDLTIPISLNPYGNEDYPAFAGCMAIEKVLFTRGNGVPFDYSHWWGTSDNADLAPWNMNYNIVKTIVISNDITSLGRFMFLGCNIGELTIPVCVECGDTMAFHSVSNNGYPNLTKVTITNGGARGCDYTPGDSKYNPWNTAQRIDILIVEEGVTKLGSHTFYGCNAVKVILPNSLAVLGQNTFGRCIVVDLTIPISLNAVWLDDDPAFSECYDLKTVTFLPGTGYGFDYAKDDGHDCWYEKTPWYVCQGCMMSITFEEGIKHIGSYAFCYQNQGQITIPDSVESLGDCSFYRCYIAILTIPISLDAVASSANPAFKFCNLVAVSFTPGKDGIGFDYREGYYPPWTSEGGQKVNALRFDKGINYIGQYAFIGYSFHTIHSVPVNTTAENLRGIHYVNYGGGDMYPDPYDPGEVPSSMVQQPVFGNLCSERPIPLNNPVFEKDDLYDHISLCPEVLPIDKDSRYL